MRQVVVQRMRRWKKLEAAAKSLNYDTVGEMFYDLYVVQRIGMVPLAQRFEMSTVDLRRILKLLGITIRGRGGKNNVVVVMTDTLYQEVLRDGANSVAMRLGCDNAVLRARIWQWARKKRETTP